jgi:hypothetical protein
MKFLRLLEKNVELSHGLLARKGSVTTTKCGESPDRVKEESFVHREFLMSGPTFSISGGPPHSLRTAQLLAARPLH